MSVYRTIGPLVYYTPGIYEVYRGYIVFVFSVKMCVCVCVCACMRVRLCVCV